MNKWFIINRRTKGFALIATITLMVLLALLSVGLLTIASSQTRISQRGIFNAEARAQAKLALEVAIGRLQCELGPDQRISANSGILDASPDSEGFDGIGNPYVLGVWDSWTTWANRKNSSGVMLSDTYGKGRKELFRSWLISSPRENEVQRMEEGAKVLGQFREKEGGLKVQLLGPGSLGDRADKSKFIYAELVQVDDSSTPNGDIGKGAGNRKSIGWWVSGENQKAKINSPQFASSKRDDMEAFRSTWNTPGADISSIPDLKQFQKSLPEVTSGDYDRRVQSLITMDTLNLVAPGANSVDVGAYYHSITLDSMSLLSDSKFGGLKKDLNIMLSQESLPEEFKTTSDSDTGLRPYSSEDGSAQVGNRPIASWNQLHEWTNIWDSRTTSEGQDSSSRLLWQGGSPLSMIASDAQPISGMMNNRYTYVRHPILLKMYMFTGTKLNLNASQQAGSGPLGTIMASWYEVPVVVIWNPYNVAMKLEDASGNPWGTHRSSYRSIPFGTSHNSAGRSGRTHGGFSPDWWKLGEPKERWFSAFWIWWNRSYAGGGEQPHLRLLHDYGSSFRKESKFDSSGKVTKGEMAQLKPGEIMLFSLPKVDYDAWQAETQSGASSPNPTAKMKMAYLDAYPDSVPMVQGWDNSPQQVFPYAFVFDWTARYDCMEGNKFGGCSYDGYSGPELFTARGRFVDGTTDTKTITPDSSILALNYTEEYLPQNKKLGPFVNVTGLLDQKKFSTQFANLKNGPVVQDQNEQWFKACPAVLNLNWGAAGKIVMDDIHINGRDWIPIQNSDATSTLRARRGNGEPDRSRWSEFIAYHGISIKWGTKPLLSTPRSGNWDDRTKENYQAKIWQHSSPMLWGGQIAEPSDLACSYSPYQFEYKQGKGIDLIDMENILSTDGSKSAPFGGPQGEQVNKIIGSELPLHPPYSLSGFAGFRLTPGWYDDGANTKGSIAKRFSYQSGVPGVGIGNSFADPVIPASEVFSHNEIAGDPVLGDFWDHGLMVNDGLWDTWFASSLSKRPQSLNSSGSAESLDSVVKKIFSSDSFGGAAGEAGSQARALLPNNRFIPVLGGKSAEDVAQEISNAADGYKKVAKYLQIDGGFNVNSSDVNAWKAVIGGLKNRTLFYSNSEGKVEKMDSGNDEARFARFGISTSDKSHVDDMGATGVINGYPDGEFMAWTDLRKLDAGGLDKLARSMVAEVKRRGPFLNMAEFINRRLTTGEMGVKGALQAAIDKSGANSVFESMRDQYVEPKVQYPHMDAARGSYYTGAPGYLIQSDILSVLGNILTTRDDTFKVRAYGEISGKSGADIMARAWCEAVVRRGIDYVDPTNSPETPSVIVDSQTGKLTEGNLTRVNKAFGRKFQIVSFRWLSPEEV